MTDLSTVLIKRLEPAQESAWDAYVAHHPRASAYHQLVWREVIRSVFGHPGHYLVAVEPGDGRLVGCLPLVELRSRLFGHFLVSMPYFNYGGAIGDSPAIEQQLMAHAGQLAASLGAGHVEYRDVSGRSGTWGLRQDKVAMHLALPETEDALWKQLGSKVRAQVRRPEREGATTRSGGEELLPDFYGVFSRNMRDLGTPVYPRRLFREILRRYPQSRILVVDLQGQPVAAAFLLGWRGMLEIPWASSLREHNRLGVNMLLYWDVLRYAIGDGYRVFDFGRSTRDSGTYRFKRQWGAEPVQLNWHYWLRDGAGMPGLSPDNPKFRLAIAAWQRLPVAVANLVGPRIVKSLP
ncbi:MAG: FemAB family PEP-CTERM system-associated protein [Ectothiorhodospiraceae bacterium]|nr:FemAB family PEP-CTERM system-associated protein [Ectothiorhodospiraceae bacterium]